MASKNTLEKLFGSRIRVKILKFMFRNPPVNTALDFEKKAPINGLNAYEISKKIQEPLNLTKNELNFLSTVGLIRKIK